ncbi:MAG: diacylglycerol kinase [Alphaproteobacteria bacterium]|nr:diacylglycerol kinase [Alphaproteobacteria bacterium]
MPDITVDSHTKFFILLNAGSGRQDADDKQALIDRILSEGGRAHQVILIEKPERILETAREAIALARDAGGAVVVAGGDGTINAVAPLVMGSGCAFGVLPQGTFNYFCRSHGIPTDFEESVRALLTARAVPVQIGLVNDRPFLVNASLGLYPELMEERERFKQAHGRSRLNAFIASVPTLLRHHRQLHLRIESQGITQEVHTPTLFVGNNRLQLEQIGYPFAEEVDEGHLAALRLMPTSPPAMLWLLMLVAAGRLGEADNVINFTFRSITVTPSRFSRATRMKVALDGEIMWFDTPLEFRVAPQPLYTLIPDEGAAPEESQ